MTMNTDIQAASIGVNMDTLEAIQSEFDVYTRLCGDQEVIVDATTMDIDSPEMGRLSELLGEPATSLADHYLIIYLGH